MQEKIVLDVHKTEKGYKVTRPSHYLPDLAISPTEINTKGEITLGEIPRELHEGYEWAVWGNSDNRPTVIRKSFQRVGIAGRVQHDLAKMMFGNGLVYHRKSDLAMGNYDPAYIPAVEEFLEANLLETEWLFPQMLDYRYNYNSFCELILNRKRDQIVGLFHKEAEFCRLSRQNPENLRIEHLIYSPDFAVGDIPSPDRRVRIPLLTWFDAMEHVETEKSYKFAYHTRIKTPGILYYAEPYWLGLIRENGWLDVAASVPEIILAMQQNQISLKYQILIPESYFTIRYPEWPTYTREQRHELIQNLQSKIDDSLMGTKNAYKSLMTIFSDDPSFSHPQGKPEIIAIDDKLKKDSWVPSSEKADAQIVQSLGGHPSMIGLAPEGGSMGAGSGSDKRELFNIEIDTNTVEQKKILEPLNFLARYNARKHKDWEVVFRIGHNKHTTTDKNKEGTVPEEQPVSGSL